MSIKQPTYTIPVVATLVALPPMAWSVLHPCINSAIFTIVGAVLLALSYQSIWNARYAYCLNHELRAIVQHSLTANPTANRSKPHDHQEESVSDPDQPPT